jgi:hypothetical protein
MDGTGQSQEGGSTNSQGFFKVQGAYLQCYNNLFYDASKCHFNTFSRDGTDDTQSGYARIFNNTVYKIDNIGDGWDHDIAGFDGTGEGSANVISFHEQKWENNIFSQLGNTVHKKIDNAATMDRSFNATENAYSADLDVVNEWLDGGLFNNEFELLNNDFEIEIGPSTILHTVATAESTWPSNMSGNNDSPTINFVDAAARTRAGFALDTGSTGIGASNAQTTAVGAGTGSTSLTVVDANYFFAAKAYDMDPADNHWGVEAPTSDYIKIGSGSPVLIDNINYSTNVITLAAARTWSNGDDVFMVDSTDGTTVFSDIGINSSTPNIIYGPFNFEGFALGNFQEEGTGCDDWQTSTDARLSDPDIWRDVANSNPLVTGYKYMDTQTWNDPTHPEHNKRVEISHAVCTPDDGAGWTQVGQIGSTGIYNYVAPDSYWYGLLLHIVRDDDNLAMSGHYCQWHDRDANLGNPLISVRGQDPRTGAPYYGQNGLCWFCSGTREPTAATVTGLDATKWSGAIHTEPFLTPAQAIGTTHALIFHIKWDSRTLSEGGTGFCHMYVDDNPTPVLSFTGSNWRGSDLSSGGRGTYFKWGLYKSVWKWYGTAGTYSRQRHGMYVVMDSNGSHSAMLEAMHWDEVL